MKAFLRILKEFDMNNDLDIKYIDNTYSYLNNLLKSLVQGDTDEIHYGICSIKIEDDKKSIERLISIRICDYKNNNIYNIYYNAYENNSIEFTTDLWLSVTSLIKAFSDGLIFKRHKVNSKKAINIINKVYIILKYYYNHNN